MKLDNLPINTLITEFQGPITGVNYGGTDPAYCVVTLTGPGSGAQVKVQYNITPIVGFLDQNAITIPSPAGWVDVATISGYGLTHQAITVRANLHWLRVIISTTGTGFCTAGGRWAKR